MSRQRPDRLFEVTNWRGKSVIVLARHAKGARSVASEYLGWITPRSDVVELPAHLSHKARNRSANRSSTRKGV